MRLLSVSGVLLAVAFIGTETACVSTASPPGDPAPGQCDFLLPTPVEVVQISGVSFATATVKPGPCTMHASPNYSMVCLSMQGEDSSGQCASESGGPAVVYYAYRPGATYVVTGQGCASTFAPPYTMCQDLGPSHFTL